MQNELIGNLAAPLQVLAKKVANSERITIEEGITLFESDDISLLGMLAGIVRRRLNGNRTYFRHAI